MARELLIDHPERAPVFVQDDDVWLHRDGDEPLRLTLEGSDLDALAAECWEMISEYRGD